MALIVYDEDYGLPTVYPRVKVTPLRAVQIFDRRKGVCLICHQKIMSPERSNWHVAHDQARALGGSNKDDNLWPAHNTCNIKENHEFVTPAAAKAKRRRAAHIAPKELRKKGKWGKPGWKRKVGGFSVRVDEFGNEIEDATDEFET